ncbi:hypothetical protein TanjilG_10436 [Lupinus angustifolius]|uniref:Transcription factor HY5 n=1 Tax=Lupinus angustifolius TaxID=3871 RepID=A0A4P1R534_LUPAN|nr:PREDICTED: transcription factor HY5-like [Lupinus angustifolius]XP_019461352.1 PREDICTED: transcription factor HY5-like [Lupinus angustifolius]OIW01275.1 hypothetical protein TanjilG_10436 [Lupinus angustifolius]
MSLPRTIEVKPNSNTLQKLMKEGAPSSSSSSWNRPNNKRTNIHDDSDEDMFTVPDVEATQSVQNSKDNESVNEPQLQTSFHGKRSHGRNPADKEYRRLKRLLRNRVSAQQARERKKVYVNDLESRAQELEDKNSKLEESISTLINENTMLRKVLMNTRPKVDESNDA